MKPTPEAFQAIRPEPLPLHSDDRGDLVKVLTASRLGQDNAFGEIYLIRTRTGEVRGNHYHEQTCEWFLALQGRMRIRLALPGTDLTAEFVLDSAQPAILQVPARVAHALTPEGKEETLLMAYADREYDEASPDVKAHAVIRDPGGRGESAV
jgi:dTDP-4-dehydrorhamnose 3,5-epimerase-like enzyme